MILRYGENEHGAIDMNYIIQISKPNKVTLIYDTFGKIHTWETTEFEHQYLVRKWSEFQAIKQKDGDTNIRKTNAKLKQTTKK